MPAVSEHSTEVREEEPATWMIPRAFLTAWLLTGNTEASQAAVEEAIQMWDPVAGPGDLLQRAASAALKHNNEGRDDLSVPILLRNIVDLPRNLGRCFVLRHLLCLKATEAGRLLSLTASQLDWYASAAARSLAELRERENDDRDSMEDSSAAPRC